MNAGNAFGGADRVAFQEQLQDQLGRLDRQPHRAELALRLLFDPRLAAENAAIPLVAVAVMAVLF